MTEGLKPSSASVIFSCLNVAVTARVSYQKHKQPKSDYWKIIWLCSLHSLKAKPVFEWTVALRSWGGRFWRTDTWPPCQSPCFLSASRLPFQFFPHVLRSDLQDPNYIFPFMSFQDEIDIQKHFTWHLHAINICLLDAVNHEQIISHLCCCHIFSFPPYCHNNQNGDCTN